VCPDGYTNTTTNNCTQCVSPCATCSGGPESCLSCIDGYNLSGNKCVEKIYWPFPFVFIGICDFIVILISEICTKKESRFKEALIALVSVPELGSWITFLIFHYFRRGIGGSFALRHNRDSHLRSNKYSSCNNTPKNDGSKQYVRHTKHLIRIINSALTFFAQSVTLSVSNLVLF